MKFEKHPVVTKHSIGGILGNEVSLIIVPVIAAAGLLIPMLDLPAGKRLKQSTYLRLKGSLRSSLQ